MVSRIERASVVGLGKLGAPLAACLAMKGLPTIGLDVDPRRIAAIHRGEAPVFEPELERVIRCSEGRLTATGDWEVAINGSDVTYVVVATPSNDKGAFSLRYVLEAGERIGAALRKKDAYHLVVLTSTVMPGSTETQLKPLLERSSGKRCGPDFGLCYNPEFIALGTVIRDFLNPDFILIGESDARAGELLEAVYRRVCDNHPPAARMNFVSAELTKLAVNTFVTTKITFANMLARICERLPGADIEPVSAALGLDSRIGRKYLKGAISYGGPCFPRDNLALSALSRDLGVPAILAETTDRLNRQLVGWLANLTRQHLPTGGRVGILGLAYKPHSEVVEESPGLLLAQALLREATAVTLYDPLAMDNARRVLDGSVSYADSAEQCIHQADVVVVTTPWEQFQRLRPEDFARPERPRTLIDCWRLFAKAMEHALGVHYIPLGMGGLDQPPVTVRPPGFLAKL